MKVMIFLLTSRQISKMERHLRMFEKLGLRSTDLWLKTKTQVMLPEDISSLILKNAYYHAQCEGFPTIKDICMVREFNDTLPQNSVILKSGQIGLINS